MERGLRRQRSPAKATGQPSLPTLESAEPREGRHLFNEKSVRFLSIFRARPQQATRPSPKLHARLAFQSILGAIGFSALRKRMANNYSTRTGCEHGHDRSLCLCSIHKPPNSGTLTRLVIFCVTERDRSSGIKPANKQNCVDQW